MHAVAADIDVGTHHKLVTGRHGVFFINKKDTWIGRSLDLYGEWCQAEVSLISTFINEGDIVVDVGANIGAMTLPFSKMVGPSGKVLAFEPQRILSQALSANLALNEVRNTAVYHAGIGHGTEPLDVPEVIYSNDANFGAISLLFDWKGNGANVEKVPQLTLDNIFVDQCPSFIKIDVEGMELKVRGKANMKQNSYQRQSGETFLTSFPTCDIIIPRY